jgi:hypothetical protein
MPFGQHPQAAPTAQGPQSQASQQPPPNEQQPPQPQDAAPPSAFGTIDNAAEAANDVWHNSEDKWITGNIDLSMQFPTSFTGGLTEFVGTTFGDEDIVNYGEFLNDSEGLGMDLGGGIWEELEPSGA